ncbi:putative transcriptional regulator [Pontibacter ummariensis]|uniref:Putative transcriptional regulator n=1 Tax=Pontibacter ummariensis TaxID=1610492 RepID=A0A239BS07_9BACT|nr:YqgE/AlgH family protein [Pontibacter ummariensis]PRY15663.1 putative transcriptional regulator [Pontibacter ummariensis]SNS10459.1 putative transcriptional regulator [Pontibacter ummariensis]
MEENKVIKPQNGSLLISEPFMGDANFERSVVLLCSHNEEEGSFGLVLNKPSNLKLSDVVDVYNESFDVELGVGGPVQYNTLHYVHRLADLPEAVQLGEGLYWGGDFELLRTMIGAGLVEAGDIKFFLGYSGWTAGQLQEEIDKNVWIVNNEAANKLFNLDADTLWRSVLREMGGKFKVLSNYPVDPRLN